MLLVLIKGTSQKEENYFCCFMYMMFTLIGKASSQGLHTKCVAVGRFTIFVGNVWEF